MRKTLTLPSIILVCFFVFASAESSAEDKTLTALPVVKVGNAAPANAAVMEIDVAAKKYEFTPALIEAPLNTLLKIHLKAIDKEHGFEIKGVKDSCVKFKPNEPVTIEFYADKAGEFEFACCKYCGFGHGKMKGKLVVK
jgi:heme/copper-type cytochrome/quinol oxidase subunit 2